MLDVETEGLTQLHASHTEPQDGARHDDIRLDLGIEVTSRLLQDAHERSPGVVGSLVPGARKQALRQQSHKRFYMFSPRSHGTAGNSAVLEAGARGRPARSS